MSLQLKFPSGSALSPGAVAAALETNGTVPQNFVTALALPAVQGSSEA